MISTILTAACEEQNLFYAPYIPIQITVLPDFTSPTRNEYYGTSDNGICITSHGVYVLLNIKDSYRTICVWLNSKGNVIKRKYNV